MYTHIPGTTPAARASLPISKHPSLLMTLTQRITTLLLIAVAISATAQRTTRRGLCASDTSTAIATAAADTLHTPQPDSVKISGYDKPLRSSYETMFVTNKSALPISGMRLQLEYFDTSGRILHSRQCDVAADIPSGTTRQISLRSWDRQKSFYYLLSTPPRKADATPYDVRCSIIYLLIPHSAK